PDVFAGFMMGNGTGGGGQIFAIPVTNGGIPAVSIQGPSANDYGCIGDIQQAKFNHMRDFQGRDLNPSEYAAIDQCLAGNTKLQDAMGIPARDISTQGFDPNMVTCNNINSDPAAPSYGFTNNPTCVAARDKIRLALGDFNP